MTAVYTLELARAVRNPALWLIATLLQCAFAWYSLSALESYLDLQPSLGLNPNAPGLSTWLLGRYCLPATFAAMLAIPVLCMQKVAGDRQSGAFTCLLMAPISSLEIAMGKLAALATVLAAISTLSAINVLSFYSVAALDVNALLYAHLCQWLYLVACAGIGLMCSTLCRSTQGAAFSTAAVLLMLWLSSQGGITTGFSFLPQLSIASHLSRGLAGVFHTGDVLYFAAVIGITVATVTRSLENRRLFGERT